MAVEERVEAGGYLVDGAGEEVAVAVEGDGDAGVAHDFGDGFGVGAGGDQVGGEGVAGFVEANVVELRVLAGAFARSLTVELQKGRLALRPKTRPVLQPASAGMLL